MPGRAADALLLPAPPPCGAAVRDGDAAITAPAPAAGSVFPPRSAPRGTACPPRGTAGANLRAAFSDGCAAAASAARGASAAGTALLWLVAPPSTLV